MARNYAMIELNDESVITSMVEKPRGRAPNWLRPAILTRPMPV